MNNTTNTYNIAMDDANSRSVNTTVTNPTPRVTKAPKHIIDVSQPNNNEKMSRFITNIRRVVSRKGTKRKTITNYNDDNIIMHS